MDWTAVVIVVVLILVLGSAIAVGWWNLAAKASPYQDEVERARARREREAREEGEKVVIIKKSDVTGPGGEGRQGGGSAAGPGRA